MMNGDDERLADILLEWEELWKQGHDVPVAELCREYPHLADDLARSINALKATSWLDKSVEHSSTSQIPSSNGGDEPRILSGRYRLDLLIAEGGFAYVWKGYDLELHREVAVKLPKPGRLNSTDLFMAEARRVARLKHPGIVPVHDVCREDGACFIVSEFVEGGNLRDQVASKINPSRALQWVAEVAESLHYAHANGIIHRDIKPANILIDHHGRALLADFGIARSPTKSTAFAQSVGTLPYMPREQLEGKDPDARSDIYSLGVVLHELLTGKLPYSSDDPIVLRREIIEGAKIGNLPASSRSIVAKALNPNPMERYANAAIMAADLKRILARSMSRWAVGGTLISSLMVFGVAGFVLMPKAGVHQETGNPKLDPDWLENTSKLSALEQVRAVSEKLRELNPHFNGELKPTIDNDVVVALEFLTDDITDILPVRAFVGLKSLTCAGTYTTKSNGRLANLEPLKGMKLERLAINYNEQINDLSPLAGMPLTYFQFGRTNVASLGPLKDMPLEVLICGFTHISDLSPLKGMSLKGLYCDHTRVSDFSPLHGMPLEQVRCQDTPLKSLEPLRGAPLVGLECHRTEVADLEPLRGMKQLFALNILSTKVKDLSPLKETPGLTLLWCDFVPKRDAEVLRAVKSLDQINSKSVSEFWKRLDDGRS